MRTEKCVVRNLTGFSCAALAAMLVLAGNPSIAADRIHAAEASSATRDYAEAELVIKARQLRTELLSVENGYAKVRVHAEVQEVFKGNANEGETIVYYSSADSEWAPFNSGPFEPDTEWVFFLEVKPTSGDFEYFEIENSQISSEKNPAELLRALEEAWDAYLEVADQFVEKSR